ncbi:MAG: hypothetical protein HY703_10440 [Gemmatimonadetes bacterium]|nr:hypothetical protein [Gemmatimonadota bacterium]
MSSLIPFHRVLIASAIIFCFGFGVWELFAYMREGEPAQLLFGLIAAVAGTLLALYLWKLRRILKLPGGGSKP